VVGTLRAATRPVTFFDRRKGDVQRTLDRRRTYIDVVERVLRSALNVDSRSPELFSRTEIGDAPLGKTVSEVEVYLLHDLDRVPKIPRH
jgi:hypothetical protein